MPTPRFATRTLYAPAHFGNSYECLGDNEFRALLTTWRDWGFNEFAGWFDPANCIDPWHEDPYSEQLYDFSRAQRDMNVRRFQAAQSLGLPCVSVLTPNTVFQDQCRPDTNATKGGRIFGPLACPSAAPGREVILRNHENWFRTLAQGGVKLRAIAACPYDFGGCACEKCQPWILTFAKLCHELHTIAERHHPGVEMRMVGWWWSAEEHEQFADWADTNAPGWVKSITLHIPYSESDVSGVRLPKGCERQAFVHIGYADAAEPRDLYGHLGPVIAAERLERTLNALAQRDCSGWMAYSEGVFDDVNKAIVAGLSAGKVASADEALQAYAQMQFGASAEDGSAWATWLRGWGHPYDRDTNAAQCELQTLKSAKPTWRLRQWELKTELMRHHRAAAAETDSPERTAARAAIDAVQETLRREVYALGPQRFIFARNFSPLVWQRNLPLEQPKEA
ncbi:MAG: hypothetical protein KDK74_08130 [Cephaloticoccus sp.]|nr:hypothetical protein [Cephaloticoccus sp.]